MNCCSQTHLLKVFGRFSLSMKIMSSEKEWLFHEVCSLQIYVCFCPESFFWCIISVQFHPCNYHESTWCVRSDASRFGKGTHVGMQMGTMSKMYRLKLSISGACQNLETSNDWSPFSVVLVIHCSHWSQWKMWLLSAPLESRPFVVKCLN